MADVTWEELVPTVLDQEDHFKIIALKVDSTALTDRRARSPQRRKISQRMKTSRSRRRPRRSAFATNVATLDIFKRTLRRRRTRIQTMIKLRRKTTWLHHMLLRRVLMYTLSSLKLRDTFTVKSDLWCLWI